MAEITDVLTKLLELTKENKIGWQTTSDEDVFTALFGNQSVLVSGDSPGYYAALKIINKAGVEIEESSPENTSTSMIEELHRIARRVALGVDSQLDELLLELDKKAQSSG